MEYTITNTRWEHGNILNEFVERFEGTPQEITELLKFTNGMGEDRCGEVCKCNSGGRPKPLEISDFKDKKVVINCRTKDLSNEFLDKLRDKGYDTKYLDWNSLKEKTCFGLDGNIVFYAPYDFYINEGYKVIEFSGW